MVWRFSFRIEKYSIPKLYQSRSTFVNYYNLNRSRNQDFIFFPVLLPRTRTPTNERFGMLAVQCCRNTLAENTRFGCLIQTSINLWDSRNVGRKLYAISVVHYYNLYHLISASTARDRHCLSQEQNLTAITCRQCRTCGSTTVPSLVHVLSQLS